MTVPDTDPTIRELREQIRQVDRALVEGVNERIELVARLRLYKESRGIEFVDRAQEERIVESLGQENRGPLSAEGLRELYAAILAVTKREAP